MVINYLKQKHILHTWEAYKFETLHGILWQGLPPQRVIEKCKVCKKERAIYLLLGLPDDIKDSPLWRGKINEKY